MHFLLSPLLWYACSGITDALVRTIGNAHAYPHNCQQHSPPRAQRRASSVERLTEERLALARDAARTLETRVRGRQMQVRRIFIARARPDDPDPPLATMLRGGRGGRVRLLLYLSLLWVGANAPHDVTFPARAWSELLGLEDPPGKGARRIRDALDWLQDNGFVRSSLQAGQPTQVQLRKENGKDERYSVPGAATAIAKRTGQATSGDDLYVRLPPAFWTEGWVAMLSGPAVAMLLVLLSERGSRTGSGIWFTPETARARFALSDDTRFRGLQELEQHKLLRIKKRPVGRNSFEFQRRRNTYELQLANLDPDGTLGNDLDEPRLETLLTPNES
jgi:hypothetical protein